MSVGTTPHITKLMALAIKFDTLVREGVVKDYAELARLCHVTHARMSQIMSLLNLAPDIQKAILFLTKTAKGRDRISSREVIGLWVPGHAQPMQLLGVARLSSRREKIRSRMTEA